MNTDYVVFMQAAFFKADFVIIQFLTIVSYVVPVFVGIFLVLALLDLAFGSSGYVVFWVKVLQACIFSMMPNFIAFVMGVDMPETGYVNLAVSGASSVVSLISGHSNTIVAQLAEQMARTPPETLIPPALMILVVCVVGSVAGLAALSIHRTWRGWFEFRVSFFMAAYRVLYWKLGITDPYARVMVGMQHAGSYEPLVFSEPVPEIEHQPWLPWTGVVGDNDLIPSDYQLVEVTMFDSAGILDVDPQTVGYDKVDGLFWRPVIGSELSSQG